MTDQRPRYMISVAADIVGMHPQTLRIYESKGLVRPGRTPGGTRLYSEHDLERLREIQRLTTSSGSTSPACDACSRSRTSSQLCVSGSTACSARWAMPSSPVHRQYRRDVVLYSEAQRELRLPRRQG